MGAKGIKRRKPKRRLPPPQVSADDSIPPNVVWPVGQTGFEASPWSPAGQLQGGWRFADGLRRGTGGRFASAVLWFVIAVLVATLVGLLAELVS